jgi:hypothetical protein
VGRVRSASMMIKNFKKNLNIYELAGEAQHKGRGEPVFPNPLKWIKYEIISAVEGEIRN